MKVLPYIKTLGSKRFKEFLLSKFMLRHLNQVDKEEVNYEPIFEGWYGKKMKDWYKFKNDDGVILEFFPTHYEIIRKDGLKREFPLPETINDFINDMDRLGVELHWSIWIDEKFEPKDYLDGKGVEEYYRALLSKMDKSHELSQNL